MTTISSLRLISALLLAAACAPPAVESEIDESEEDQSALEGQVFAVDISLWSGEIADSEVRCWWDQGVRHVIAGDQNPRITRQQLDAALAGGMTVDLYVYLTWSTSTTIQVQEALALAAEYPEVGRLWLDVEEQPVGIGTTALKQKVAEALQACGSFECGIYTGKGFWQTYMGGTTQFSNVPLWYAWYDNIPSTSTWSTQKFGGWENPTAKQWEETYFCGIDVDKNTMIVDALPSTTPVPFAADGPSVPNAPTGMYPDDLQTIETSTTRMIVDTVQLGVSKYAFEVQSWNGTAWVNYYTYQSSKNAYRFSPAYKNKVYRFRARALDGAGWGAWSHWGEWSFGKPTKIPPSGALDPASGGDPEPEPEPEPDPAGAPTGLTPVDGATVATSSVTLACGEVSEATQYTFEIEYLDPNTASYKVYYSYAGASPTRTFYPQFHGRTYRWRVRALVSGASTPSSSWAGFYYN